MLSTWNTKSHSPQEVGQECSVVRNGEMEIKFCGEESSTFPLGTEKRAEVRRGHLAESNHVFLHISWSGPSSPSDSSRQPGLSQELASERVGRYSYTSCCALRLMAPPNEHPKTTRGRGRGRSFALRITLSIQFNWVVSVMTFQTLNRASFLQSAVLLKKKSGSKAKEETRVWKERKRQEQWRLSRLGGFPEVSQCQGQVKATHYCLWVSLCSAKFALGIVSLPTLGFSLQSLVFLKTRW